jgi:hypothetical protein
LVVPVSAHAMKQGASANTGNKTADIWRFGWMRLPVIDFYYSFKNMAWGRYSTQAYDK